MGRRPPRRFQVIEPLEQIRFSNLRDLQLIGDGKDSWLSGPIAIPAIEFVDTFDALNPAQNCGNLRLDVAL